MAQSRKRCLIDGVDNAGFAAWVRQPDVVGFFGRQREGTIVYGEWAGPGVQKGDAIGEVGHRVFCIFALANMESGEALCIPGMSRSIELEPDVIRQRLESAAGAPLPENVHILPWHSAAFELTLGPLKTRAFPANEGEEGGEEGDEEGDGEGGDAEDGDAAHTREAMEVEDLTDPELAGLAALRKAESAAILEVVNAQVDAIGECDPWVAETFGVNGTGEGLVLNPIAIGGSAVTTLGAYGFVAFKAKAEHHAVKMQKRPAQIDTAVAASTKAFANQMITPARCRQGVQEACGGDLDIRCVGNFLKWVGRDVQKEGVAELETAGLEWKHVKKAVNEAAKRWFVKAAQNDTV